MEIANDTLKLLTSTVGKALILRRSLLNYVSFTLLAVEMPSPMESFLGSRGVTEEVFHIMMIHTLNLFRSIMGRHCRDTHRPSRSSEFIDYRRR